MRFPFNAGKDPVVCKLVEYAGSEELCEQAMHNAYQDKTRERGEVKIALIMKHIDNLKNPDRCFISKVWEDSEQEAYVATRILQLWLGTISHVDGAISHQTQMALAEMIRSAGWEDKTKYDEQLGINLLE